MRDSDERVILVDQNDRETGTMDKLEAHRKGLLHRAISIFVFDSAGGLVLQRRALGKYHAAGLWANSCCTHPRPGEVPLAAAHRRLVEELGIDCDLGFVGKVLYRADVGAGLVEHELVSAYRGRCDETPRPDPGEVMQVRSVAPDVLRREVAEHPERFASWFRIYVTDHFDMLFDMERSA